MQCVSSDYATLSDDRELVAVDGLLRIAVLGLDILGEVVDDSLVSDELVAIFLLLSYKFNTLLMSHYIITCYSLYLRNSLDYSLELCYWMSHALYL